MPPRTRVFSPQTNRYSGAGLGRFHMPSARKKIRRNKSVPGVADVKFSTRSTRMRVRVVR